MRCLAGKTQSRIVTLLAPSLALAVVCGGGCHTGCPDIAPGAIPRETGTYSCQWQTAQIARGNLDHFVIYENEWYLGGTQLGPAGQRHIADIAHHMQGTQYKAIIEPHFDQQKNALDDAVNQARVDAVIKSLASSGVEDAPARVVMAVPQAEGLEGGEAVRLGAQRLQSGPGGGTNSGGPFGGTGTTTSSSGFGAGGLTAGGGF